MAEKKRWVREPLFVDRKVETHGKHDPIRVAIHTTECADAPGLREIDAVVNFWKRQNRGLGAHVIIDKDGNAAKCAAYDRITYAVANRNTGTIHFELIGFAKFLPQVWWLRLRQLNKLAKWLAYLNMEYGIRLEHSTVDGVAGHRDYPGQTHTDPGRYFPMKYVLRKAREFRANGWT
jgi:N-acetyl-anhydromuramyl-L-alanine amidase AmpD